VGAETSPSLMQSMQPKQTIAAAKPDYKLHG